MPSTYASQPTRAAALLKRNEICEYYEIHGRRKTLEKYNFSNARLYQIIAKNNAQLKGHEIVDKECDNCGCQYSTTAYWANKSNLCRYCSSLVNCECGNKKVKSATKCEVCHKKEKMKLDMPAVYYLYKQGFSVLSIARAYNVTMRAVHAKIIKANLNKRPDGQIIRKYKEINKFIGLWIDQANTQISELTIEAFRRTL